MKVCRLCGSSNVILDLFDKAISNFKRRIWIHFVALATSIHIKEDDLVSRMLCHTCCKIVEKMYKFRIQAITNDKLLKEQLGILDTLSSKGLQELQGHNGNLVSEAACDTQIQNLSAKVVNDKHPSVIKLFQMYPGIQLPNYVYRCDVAPIVALDTAEITEWHENYFKRYQEKLSLLNVTLKRASSTCKTDQPSSLEENHNSIVDNFVDIDSKLQSILTDRACSNKLQHTVIDISDTPENDTTNRNFCLRYNKPCPKSKKVWIGDESTNFTNVRKFAEDNSLKIFVKEAVLSEVSNIQSNHIPTTEPIRIKKKRKHHMKLLDFVLKKVIPHKKKCISMNKRILSENTEIKKYPDEKNISLHTTLLSTSAKSKDELNSQKLFVCHICSKLYDTSNELCSHQKWKHSSARKTNNQQTRHTSKYAKELIIKTAESLHITTINKIKPIDNFKEVHNMRGIEDCISKRVHRNDTIAEKTNLFIDNKSNTEFGATSLEDLILPNSTGVVNTKAKQIEECLFTDMELIDLLSSPVTLDDLPNTTFHHQVDLGNTPDLLSDTIIKEQVHSNDNALTNVCLPTIKHCETSVLSKHLKTYTPLEDFERQQVDLAEKLVKEIPTSSTDIKEELTLQTSNLSTISSTSGTLTPIPVIKITLNENKIHETQKDKVKNMSKPYGTVTIDKFSNAVEKYQLSPKSTYQNIENTENAVSTTVNFNINQYRSDNHEENRPLDMPLLNQGIDVHHSKYSNPQDMCEYTYPAQNNQQMFPLNCFPNRPNGYSTCTNVAGNSAMPTNFSCLSTITNTSNSMNKLHYQNKLRMRSTVSYADCHYQQPSNYWEANQYPFINQNYMLDPVKTVTARTYHIPHSSPNSMPKVHNNSRLNIGISTNPQHLTRTTCCSNGTLRVKHISQLI